MHCYKLISLTLLFDCLLSGFYIVTATVEIKGETEYFPSHPPHQHVQHPTYVTEVHVTKPSYPHKPGHQHSPPHYNHDYHPAKPVHHEPPYKPIHVVPVTEEPALIAPSHTQTIPLVGAIFGTIPNYIFPWNNIGQVAQFPSWGNLGQLPSLGSMGHLPSLGSMGHLPSLGGFGEHQCPLGQFKRCRCESLLPGFKPKSIGTDTLEIVQQSVKVDEDGDTNINAHLNNGLTIHQKTHTKMTANNEEIQLHEGDFVLKISDERYLVIYFNIEENDFSVKANMTKEPPQNVNLAAV